MSRGIGTEFCWVPVHCGGYLELNIIVLSAQGVDERMINVHYYYYYKLA